ncbi:MAG TPA: radical SAM protein [Elusimicrobia bacterium]|nr:MAG: radical SAM protein [Elusimicrobia bacterium RIFOXYA12_FULL_49_49]OGS10040.1 MAG: radical SAM protein [Elusimicrobia bacterium RIFOXYA1_FULL_47_7]OGS10595.1 MAG: radical SAM protein [Elusimicrobia bacterium RIFOXYB1_FULL_48_9]OGS16055.1 MAG: radical SAM protein [Elusimicrobia bacterium RIFOXYA2_FULL_47_53]OGS30193.1 MAG: radical SAM protein [Elusimicrobia bacterium RIFOXYB2_FULL_46_23]HBU69302.1 radical SAM protein [Elusimicrobiota bacterium]
MSEIAVKVEKLYSLMKPCRLCPRLCGVDRNVSTGVCRSGAELYISSYNLHFGEEPPISGTKGSGTVFFTNCSLSCLFCQNYPISQLGNGRKISTVEFSDIMLELGAGGAHNINFVTPTHFAPLIADSVAKARAKGLKIPMVYNCSGYENIETLKLLEGIIDIYLPDAKYSSEDSARECSGAEDYWEINRKALKEMHRQVGVLRLDENGIATRGLIVRHMVLPHGLSGSGEVLEFIAKEISPRTFISLMAQYHPAHRAGTHPKLSRRLLEEEYGKVVEKAAKLGLDNGWIQEF